MHAMHQLTANPAFRRLTAGRDRQRIAGAWEPNKPTTKGNEMSATLVNSTTRLTPSPRWLRLTAPLLAITLLCGLTACKTTRQVTKESYYEPSGFLGDYSQLQPGTNGQARLIYMKPGVQWSKYTKVWVKPIELWRSDDPEAPMGKLTPEDQQILIDLLNTSLANSLTNYQMVSQGGSDVLVIHAALTDARKSKPVAGAISSIYLPLKLISLGKQAIAGTAIGVGMVTIEAELLDGQSNERLVAAVDSRSGTVAIRSKFTNRWGDVEKSFDWWANRLATRLAEERAGLAVKTEL